VTITVSIALSAEADELAAAMQALVPQLTTSNPPPGLDAVKELLAHDAITQFVARAADGSIVGVSTLAVFPIPTARRAWIEDVIVDEASSGRGVGAALVQAMLDRARELGCVTVDLTSRPSREAANHLYKKLGFHPRETNVYRYEL
jgi:ribosomal protein S18 acetylase RimI-like enzyme